MALGSVVIDLLLRTGSFSTDTKKAERRLKEMEQTAKRVGAAIGTAIVGGVTAATYAIRSQITAMDELSKAALRAHMPTEEFSQLAYAGSLADVEMGNLVTSMGRLARAQSDAQRGLTTQTDAFEKLGIAFEDSSGKMRSGMDVLKDFADVVQRRKGDPEVLAAGMQVFGRSFQNLIPLLSQGRAGLEAAADEANRLGITLGTEAGRQAEEFNDNLTRLKTAVDGVVRGVAVDLLPKLVELTERTVEWVGSGNNMRRTIDGITDSIESLAGWLVAASSNFGLFRAEIAKFEIGASLYNPLTHVRSALVDGGEYRDEQMALWEKANADAEKYRERLDRLSSGQGLFGPRRGSDFRGVTGGSTTAADSAAEAARRAAEEAAIRESEARAAATAAAARSSKERAEAEKALADAIREVEEAERKAMEAEMASEDRRLGWMSRIDDMVAQVEGPVAVALVNYRRQLAELNAALAVGDISMQDYQRAAQALGQTLGNVVAEVNTATGEITVFAEQAARNIQSFLGDATYDLLDGRFRDIADSFSDMIKRMLAEISSSRILDMLAQIGKNNSGTWWGSMLGGLSGTRASGGNVASGGTYLVGEQGPELLRMGPRSGTIVPNHAIGGGSGVSVQVINNGPPMQAQASTETQPDGTQLVRLVLNEVASDIANGGRVWQATKMRGGLKEAV